MRTAVPTLVDTWADEHPEACRLAELLSLAAHIEPSLLRAARLSLRPIVPVCAEADLWFSPLTDAASPSGFTLQSDAAAILQRRLARDPAALEHARRVVTKAHGCAPETVVLQERVMWLALRASPRSQQQIDQIWRRAYATIVRDHDRSAALTRWARRALASAPPAAQRSEAAQLLAARAGLDSTQPGDQPDLRPSRIQPPEPLTASGSDRTFDVFVCYSSHDSAVVHDLARRLRDRGLRVWLDAWEIQPGDSIPSRIEAGLEYSATLALCLSEHALGSDWPALENQTFRFREPLNRERRFIPVRLDDAPPARSLAQLQTIDWRNRDEEELAKLVRACRPVSPKLGLPPTRTVPLSLPGSTSCVIHHPDGHRLLGACEDGTVRVWDLATGEGEGILMGHTDSVLAVACHPNGTRALSASADHTVRVWNLVTGTCQRVLEGHANQVLAVAYSPDGSRALSASADHTVRVWNLVTGTCQRVLEGHANQVLAVAYSPDGSRALSASADHTVRVWNLATGSCHHVLRGHVDHVQAVACSPDGKHALSASHDSTVRVWDLRAGTCELLMEGHTGPVSSAAYHAQGHRVISADIDGTVRVWDVTSGICQRVLKGHTRPAVAVAYHPFDGTITCPTRDGTIDVWGAESAGERQPPIEDEQVTYTNAKVVLVGESQAGKSGLAMRLAHDRWEHTESTLGAWATHLHVPVSGDGVSSDREIWLWDFGGQADQRLIHQLHLGDAQLAVLVFDGQRDDVMARLLDWNRALKAAAGDIPRLLAAGRTDVNPVRLSRGQLDELRTEGGFVGYLETSAKTGAGCADLRDAIVQAIDWERVPWRSSPIVFQRLKAEILLLKDGGLALTSTKQLRDWLPARVGPLEPDHVDAVIGLLAGPGAVLALGFGGYILLRPELLNVYAQAVIRSLRDDPQERGCITEDRVLRGELNYPGDFERLPDADERIVLHAMHERLVERGICLRDHDPRGRRATLLIFPSYYRRERPDRPHRPQAFTTYSFDGYLDEIYATLVVRLHHSELFERDELWRNAADFTTPGGKAIGVRLNALSDGSGEIDLYCEPDTPPRDQALLARYVHDHLAARAGVVKRLRTYICPRCETPVENREAARRRLEQGKRDILCVACEQRIELLDDIERLLSSADIGRQVEQIRAEAELELDSHSRERLLVGEVIASVARAGQIAREVTVSDRGIDMEIEFTNDAGHATGRKLYLQLEPGGLPLGTSTRDDRRVFRIDKPRRADYWADQQFPVMLVVRDTSGTIEWMEIGDHLRSRRATGDWPPRTIDFQGERLDVMSIRRWRERMLAPD